jgi:hypothetical protein
MPKIKEHYKRLAWCYFLLDKKRQPLWTAFFIPKLSFETVDN